MDCSRSSRLRQPFRLFVCNYFFFVPLKLLLRVSMFLGNIQLTLNCGDRMREGGGHRKRHRYRDEVKWEIAAGRYQQSLRRRLCLMTLHLSSAPHIPQEYSYCSNKRPEGTGGTRAYYPTAVSSSLSHPSPSSPVVRGLQYDKVLVRVHLHYVKITSI
jgi:hypothetical protein